MSKSETHSDAELVAAALAGGPEAFGPIVERYRDAVFAVALSRLRSFHDAEDVAQTVFVEAFGGLRRLKDLDKLGPWLRTMAINRAIDLLRSRKPMADVYQAEAQAARTDPRDSPGQTDLRESVLAAIGKLGQRHRETVTLFYINGYSIAEVAGMQQVAEGTIKARLHDARKKLKEEMLGMVENVLKSEAPKEDFAERVFELLNLRTEGTCPPYWHGRYRQADMELRRIGDQGIEGFLRALLSPHGPTRNLAVHMIAHRTAPTDERIIAALMRVLSDPNKKVRSHAVHALMGAKVSDDRKRSEFVPLIAPLLLDKNKRVRRAVAGGLNEWPNETPTELVAEALLKETDKHTRWRLSRLMNSVLLVRRSEKKI